MLQLDAGDMLWARSRVSEHERAQRLLKAQLLLEASAHLGLDAMGVGDGDLAFGLKFLEEAAEEHKLPYVAANLARSDGALVFPGHRVIERGGLRFGITSILIESAVVPDEVRILPMLEALKREIQALKAKGVDLVVLLSHQGLREDKNLIFEVEGLDLIFGAHSRAHQEDPVILGTTAIFQAGSRGKYLGQVAIDLVPGGEGFTDPKARARVQKQRQRLQKQLVRVESKLADPEVEGRSRLERSRQFTEKRIRELVLPPADDGKHHRLTSDKIAMDRGVSDDPGMKALVDSYLERLGELPGGGEAHGHDHSGHGHDHSGHGHHHGAHGHDHGAHGHGHGAHGHDQGAHGVARPPGSAQASLTKSGPYVGAKACLGCHPVQHADWSKTSHADAYRTLVVEKRQFDLDCWSCHVTGAGRPGGPTNPQHVEGLRNVQCEACHGPGRKHIQSPVDAPMIRQMSEAGCKGCHSDEQTMGRFVYADYLPKVDHKPKTP